MLAQFLAHCLCFNQGRWTYEDLVLFCATTRTGFCEFVKVSSQWEGNAWLLCECWDSLRHRPRRLKIGSLRFVQHWSKTDGPSDCRRKTSRNSNKTTGVSRNSIYLPTKHVKWAQRHTHVNCKSTAWIEQSTQISSTKDIKWDGWHICVNPKKIR